MSRSLKHFLKTAPLSRAKANASSGRPNLRRNPPSFYLTEAMRRERQREDLERAERRTEEAAAAQRRVQPELPFATSILKCLRRL